MSKKYLRQKMWWCFLLILVLAFQNCAKQNFSEDGSSAPIRPEVTETQVPDDTDLKVVTESFSTLSAGQNPDTDMLMVIDNSSSMNDEVEKIKANIKKFQETVAASLSFKMAVISQATITLQDELDLIENPNLRLAIFNIFEIIPGLSHENYYQIDRYVWSDEPLELAAVYTQNVFAKSFFRENSQKSFVFITDDNSFKSADSFLGEMTLLIPQNKMKAFAFAGIEGQSPCAANPGTEYKKLAQMTGGQLFNLCANDWSSHFADLTQSLVGKAQSKFLLKNSQIAEVRKVTLNERQLTVDEYRVKDGQLEILTPLENSAATITIVYLLP